MKIHGQENKRLTAIENILDMVSNILNSLGLVKERILEMVNKIVDEMISENLANLTNEMIERKIKIHVEEYLDEQNDFKLNKNTIIIYNLPEDTVKNLK